MTSEASRDPRGVTPAQIDAAAARLRGHAVVTPLLENAVLNAQARGRVLLKAEMLQHTGSFKFRGAWNRLSQLSPAERAAGVVAWSSGNHAQGVAYAAQLLGIRAAIVMPKDAPRIKTENTRRLGGEVIQYDRYTESREEIGTRLARERGAVIVPAYDDPHIVAGQGTVGREIAAQAQALGLQVDQALFCCSGGGLVAGSALALKAARAATQVYSVEPAGFDDHARSLAAPDRQRVRNADGARSICDALQAPTPGDVTYPINRELLAGGLVVTDDEVRAAMRFAFETLKLVVEPGGAIALAAVLASKIPTAERITAVVLSGGNVDPALFVEIVGAPP
jgi:threonine dehydratase